jgi:UDP-N-acetylmuramyl tripeptide synthase
MPLFLTILIAKSLLRLSRLLGRGGGSALPGLVAERIDPHIGLKLARRISHGSIVITGTNGKTTTTKMLARILSDSGERLVMNRAGSNLSRGVVSALIEHASWRGRFAQTMGLFEVDEAAMLAVTRMVQPRDIVVLNLFRDQLDRYGELDTTAKLIGSGISVSEATLHLNADDPLVASLASYAHDAKRVEFFGLDDIPAAQLAHDITADSNTCPICGRALKYTKVFYGHIGHYKCPEGHFDRPQPLTHAAQIQLGDQEGVSFDIVHATEHAEVSMHLPGIYNVYNAIAALGVAVHLGIPLAHGIDSLEQVRAAFGRVEKLQLGSKTLYLLLVKNPTGFNQIIQTFLLNKKQQNALIIINDNFADGRDISWLWDVAFEDLRAQHHVIDVAGLRATDMALRLKYTEIPVRDLNHNIGKALNQFIDQLPENGTGYIVPTYTAMLETRKRLGKKVKLSGVWQ